jgi:hypothetical protein
MMVKQKGREADHSPPHSAKVKNFEAIPPLPLCTFVALRLINQT